MIYYAHHLYKYNTEIEKYELRIIKEFLPNYSVLNPNIDIEHEDFNDEKRSRKNALKQLKNVRHWFLAV